MMKNIFNIKKYIEKLKKSIDSLTRFSHENKFKFSALGVFIICVLILFISNSFAADVPVETTSFTSSQFVMKIVMKLLGRLLEQLVGF